MRFGPEALQAFDGRLLCTVHRHRRMRQAPDQLTTARLVGRRFDPADLPDLEAFYADREVMRFG